MTHGANRLQTEYEAAALTIVELLSLIAEAEIAIQEVNQELPHDAEPLELPVPIRRGCARRPETIVSKREIEGWAFESTGVYVPDQAAVRVFRDTDERRRGQIQHPAVGGVVPAGTPCIWSKFVQVTYEPADPGSFADPIYKLVNLPGLLDAHRSYWEPEAYADQVSRLAAERSATKRPMSNASAQARERLVRYEPMQGPKELNSPY